MVERMTDPELDVRIRASFERTDTHPFPLLPERLLERWQRIVDTLAEVLTVPSANITRVDQPMIEVVRSSSSIGNPYRTGETTTLARHYCEAVYAGKGPLAVHDARTDPDWDRAPELEYGMVAYLGYPIHYPSGEVFGTICILDSDPNPFGQYYKALMEEFRDAIETDLRLLYNAAKLETKNAELRKTKERLLRMVEEKETLLREAHHRIKNNVSMIMSILDLEADMTDDAANKSLISDIRGRIRSIGLIHEQLYQSADLATISVVDYFTGLINPLVHSLGRRPPRVHYDLAPIRIATETALTVGLIVTELTTNALKYAFPDDLAMDEEEEPTLEIGLRPLASTHAAGQEGTAPADDAASRFVLTVVDNGVGLPRDIDPANCETLGLQIVDILVNQLGGEYTIERRADTAGEEGGTGTRFVVQFPNRGKD